MSTHAYKVSVSPAPFVCGFVLWASATALLCEEAWHAGAITVQSAMMPVLTSSAVAAGVMAHVRLMQWRAASAVLFAALALLGSALCVAGTLGRVAGTHDTQIAKAGATNAATKRLEDDLAYAKAERAKECRTRGKRCASWDERVDAITAELEGRVTVSADPRADAIVRVAVLFGAQEGYTRQLIAALDAPSLPLYLEIGALVFFGAAFHPRKIRETETVAPNSEETVSTVLQPLTVRVHAAQALRDFRDLGEVGSQQFLANRWGRDKSTVCRWLQDWEREGLIARQRAGKVRPVLALPAPASIAP